MAYDFSGIAFPAFVTVYGPEKHDISSHNRREYPSYFAAGVCHNAEQAAKLLVGYCGSYSSLEVYVATLPERLYELYPQGIANVEDVCVPPDADEFRTPVGDF